MSATETPAITVAAGLRVVHDSDPQVVGDVMARFGLTGPNPVWVGKLLNEQLLRWLLDRWDGEQRILKMHDTDNTPILRAGHRQWVRFEDAQDLVVLEVLTGITVGHHANGTRINTPVIVPIVNAARTERAASIRYLSDSTFRGSCASRLRVWQEMFDLATAHPDAEWLRDEVRLAVVKANSERNLVLPLGEIRQPWLRTMTTNLLRARTPQLSPLSLYNHSWAVVRLSWFLATRDDGGNDPYRLVERTIEQFSEHLAADPGMSETMHIQSLDSLSPVLSQARALELAPSRLRSSFAVKRHHYPVIPQEEHVARAIPVATFRLLMGTDRLLGSDVHALLTSFRANEFDGLVLLALVRFMANFGRRLNEACDLLVARIRFDDHGGAAILYDDFKSKRNRVWLPMDAAATGPLRDYIEHIREHFPNTPDDQLRLFPKDKLGGTLPINTSAASDVHRCWVRTLEELIVVAKLNKATNIPVERLLEVSCADLVDGLLAVNQTSHCLNAATRNMLVDYRQNVLTWETRAAKKTKREPTDPGLLPLFPDWKAKRGGYKAGWKSLSLPRLAPLGQDWVERAAAYPSPGLPGGHLGQDRVHPDDVHIERLRHTNLQHAYNATRDIFLVKELAGHSDVATTIEAYVSTTDQLREAVEKTSQYRRDIHGRQPHYDLPLATRRVGQVPGECGNPQVLDLGICGCPKDGDCGDCDHFVSDPSNLPELRQRIASAQKAIATAQAEPDATTRDAKVRVLKLKIKTWRKVATMHKTIMDGLPDDERERLEMACEVVRDFRESVRQGAPVPGAAITFLDAGPGPLLALTRGPDV